ncbi:MAG: TetR/AcrR family transcriptional regulator [Hyphomonadaceae bacterium]|nr:TetR/AcrR family transcriptional regulator [Hyphomonadaceae bacterium]
MPRPAGSRNADYDAKRAALIAALTDLTLATPALRPSLRHWALACGVTEPTLKHYFGDREGVAIAILEEIGARSRGLIDAVAEPAPDLAQAVDTYIALSKIGLKNGAFAHAHCFGIVEGVAHPDVGRAYLAHLLEPSLDALEARLAPFHPEGRSAARAAALALFAPMLLAVVHQQALGGDSSAPMDVDAIIDAVGALLRTPR